MQKKVHKSLFAALANDNGVITSPTKWSVERAHKAVSGDGPNGGPIDLKPEAKPPWRPNRDGSSEENLLR